MCTTPRVVLFLSSGFRETDEEEEDDDGVFLRITKHTSSKNNIRNEKPAVQVSFINIHDVIDANSPNEYAQTAQIERVSEIKRERLGWCFARNQ